MKDVGFRISLCAYLSGDEWGSRICFSCVEILRTDEAVPIDCTVLRPIERTTNIVVKPVKSRSLCYPFLWLIKPIP